MAALPGQLEDVHSVLTELLRLYDWRNEIGRIERDFNHDKKQVTTWLNRYGREKKAAWEAARRVLAGAPPSEPDGYAVLLDDPGATPGDCGYWYVGAYRTEVVAKGVAERNKGARVIPMYFAPPAENAPLRLMSQCARHQGLPITITAMAHAAIFYCPHCEAESASPDSGADAA